MKDRNKYFDFEEIINFLEKESLNRKKFNLWINHELNLYKHIIKNLDIENLDISRKFGITSQYFTCAFYFDKKIKSFFKCAWNINTAKKIIEKESLPLIKIPIDDYKNCFIDTDICKNYALNTNLNNPIIFVDFKIMEYKMVLIDGNHRFYKAIKQNDKYINAYKLNENQSLNALASDEYRLLFKLYKNLWYIINIDFHKKYVYDDLDLFQLDNTVMSSMQAKYLLKNQL